MTKRKGTMASGPVVETGKDGKAAVAARISKKTEGYIVCLLARCKKCRAHIVVDIPGVVVMGMRQERIKAFCGKCGFENDMQPHGKDADNLISAPTQKQRRELGI